MIEIDSRKIKYFDYLLFFAVLSINIIGIFTIHTTENSYIFSLRQTAWVFLGSIIAIYMANIDTRRIKQIAKIVYFISLILLVVVFVNGALSHGAKRWIAVSFIHIQPSEFVKIAVILMLAYYFDENPKSSPYTLKELIIPLVIVFLPVLLILKQPDLGTSVIVLSISFSIILFAKIKRSLILKILLLFTVFLPFFYSSLRDYQKDRIMAFLNPYSAPTTYGYHIIQSEIAIGSGGIFGKGIENATQTTLNFLPENHTDFIFSVYSEQHGMVGDMILIFLYLVIILRGIEIIKGAKSDFERFMCIGIVVMLWISFVFNIGMTLGLLPVVGIPLMFFSYGGSAILVNFFAIGILLSVRIRSYM